MFGLAGDGSPDSPHASPRKPAHRRTQAADRSLRPGDDAGIEYLYHTRVGERPQPGRCLIEACFATAGFVLLAVVLMHPLFSDLGGSTLDANRDWIRATPDATKQAMQRDIYLFVWTYAWDWHALTTHPWGLFDANIFHPAPGSLAYSEHALGKLLVTAPLYALTRNAIFAYQVDLLACFALSAGALFYALRRLGLHPVAALLAGFVYAFGPARIDSIYHTYLLAGWFLPLILLALDRTLVEARVRSAVWLATLLLLQLLTSYYTAYMTLIGLAVYGLALLAAGRGHVSARGTALSVGAGGLALAVFVIPSLPYLAMRASGTVFSYDAAIAGDGLSAFSNGAWRNYLLPVHLIRAGWTEAASGGYAYLGIAPVLLALYGTFQRDLPAPVRRLRAGSLALAVTAWLFALGPRLPIGDGVAGPYAAAMWAIPGFASMRQPARFGLMVLTGVSLLVGVGADALLRRARFATGPLAAIGIGGALLALVAVDYGYGTERYDVRRFEYPGNTPEVYRALASLPPGPVLELPFKERSGRRATEYMVWSTIHWNPILNGSSGYGPQTSLLVGRLAGRLPAPTVLHLLGRMTGVRYVVLHEAALSPGVRPLWRNPSGLELVGTFDDDRLYRVTDPPEPDLMPAVIECASKNRGCQALRQRVRRLFRPRS